MMGNSKLLQTVCIFVALLPVVAAETSGLTGERDKRYRVQPNDVLELQFQLTPDFNQTVTVSPDGFIGLREAGEVKVSGQTIPEIKESIIRNYRGILRDPLIYISLKDFERSYVVVGGEVNRPGKVEMRGPLTLAEAIFQSGGSTQFARLGEVLVFRKVSEKIAEVRRVDLRGQLSVEGSGEMAELRSGDMIYVPLSRVGKLDRFLDIARVTFFFNPVDWLNPVRRRTQ
jgi:protein involved in polysaccharide export with SLBB domain